MSIDDRRRKAEKSERIKLEKAGRLADTLKTSLEKEEFSGNSKPSVEDQMQTQHELLKRKFKEKALNDRGHERDRGR